MNRRERSNVIRSCVYSTEKEIQHVSLRQLILFGNFVQF